MNDHKLVLSTSTSLANHSSQQLFCELLLNILPSLLRVHPGLSSLCMVPTLLWKQANHKPFFLAASLALKEMEHLYPHFTGGGEAQRVCELCTRLDTSCSRGCGRMFDATVQSSALGDFST